MFNPRESFQTLCRWCHKKFEGDSAEDAIRQAEVHERDECPRKPPQ